MSTSALPPLYGGRTAEHKLDILVVGCGLGGLAAAYALGRAGHNITIVEGAPAIGEVGAGIQVSPNVSRVLISFGLADRLRNEAVEPLGIVFRRYDTGELLGRTDWTNMNDLYDSPYYHVHRADMHKMLSDVALSLPNVTLRLNTTVTAYTGDASIAVQPTRGDGPKETLKADLIIGADGVKSLLRSAVIGQQDQPRPTGDAAFRALVPAEKMLEHEDLKEFIEYPHMTSWMGPGRHIMGYCISGKKEYNLVLLHPDTGSVESWSQEGSADKMRAEFAGWEPRLEKLLSFVPSTLQWKLMDRLPLPTWIHPDQRLVLLGDSCHPMLPYRAQGAAMAIEDGAVIGALFARLQNKEQVPTLLKAYQALRHTRTAEVQASSRLNQHIFHLEDGPEQVQRDNAMRTTLAGAPGGGYPPAVIAAKANPEAYAASVAAAAPAAPGHEGNPNQWADARKSRALFGYDAERAAEEWLVANNLETVPPRAAALASTVSATATTTAATTTGSDGEASDEDLADVQSSNGNKTLIESEAGGDAGLLAKKLGVVPTPAVEAVARIA